MKTKMNLTEIVPARDVLVDELENIKGGSDCGSICLKGCITGDKSSDKKEEQKELNQG
jgi:hypothetical protein